MHRSNIAGENAFQGIWRKWNAPILLLLLLKGTESRFGFNVSEECLYMQILSDSAFAGPLSRGFSSEP